jgi:hypothetical protein
MTLQSGCRFVVAPHFPPRADWPRLLIGAGVQEADGGFFPLPTWRPPTAAERDLLIGGADRPTDAAELQDSVCLFQLPGHLRSQWWTLLEPAAGALGIGPLPGFDGFVRNVVEFLAFKELPIPAGTRCTVVVSNPAQHSVSWGLPTAAPVGMRCNLPPSTPWPMDDEHPRPHLWGAINLGDEQTSVVMINLPCRQLHADLARRFPDRPTPETVGELARDFLHLSPDYPPLRLVLGPGEGYHLPPGGLILDCYLVEKHEPDVLMLIVQE